MRDIIQYPIEASEVVQTLTHLIAQEQAKELIGGNDLLILHGLSDFLKQHPQVLAAVVDSLRVPSEPH